MSFNTNNRRVNNSTSESNRIIVDKQQQPRLPSIPSQQQLQSSSNIVIEDKNNTEQVKKFAFAVCREYLAGAWKDVDFADFEISRISAGLSNYLYICGIKEEKFAQVDNEPRRILLRLYGEHSQKNSAALLKDIVVSAIMGDHQLGPKLYGLFPIGRLEEFISYPTMDQNDMYVPELSRSIARVMARFHTLEMPLNKEPRWLFETTQKYIKQVATEVRFSEEQDLLRFQKFLSFDLSNEFKQLKTVLRSINSPVVFCHNDINIGNILKMPNKLMIIDYEYGSYNYRGFDIGNHFCEWMMNNNYEKHPYFQYNFELYPTRAQQVEFLSAYLEEFKRSLKMNQSSGNSNESKANSKLEDKLEEISLSEDGSHSQIASKNLNIENLIVEANYFALASSLFWANWAVYQASVCKIKFEYLDYALARCDAYFRLKKILFPDGFSIVN